MSGERPGPLGACLIVRDEAARLERCLTSLRPVAQEIVVADTGSVDGSEVLAERWGARVVRVSWEGHFARARNAALGHCSTEWVLSVDADEVLEADPRALQAVLAGAAGGPEAFSLEIATAGGPDAFGLSVHREPKLFRRELHRWSGRVHERLVRAEGGPVRAEPLPAGTARLAHFGYEDPAEVREKAARNAALGELEVAELARGGASPELLARARVDLGRSYLGCGRDSEARAAFAQVRATGGSGAEWRFATDFLARLALSGERLEEALGLVEELREGGASPSYCGWLRALALAGLGRLEEARASLPAAGSLRDLAGRPLDEGRLEVLRAQLGSGRGPVPRGLERQDRGEDPAPAPTAAGPEGADGWRPSGHVREG